MSEAQDMHRRMRTERTAAGVRWQCWRIGIAQYQHRSCIGTIQQNARGTGYYAIVDGQALLSENGRAKQFRTFDTAAAAMVKLARGCKPKPRTVKTKK